MAQAACADFTVPDSHTTPSTSPMASGGSIVIDASFCSPTGLNNGGGAAQHGTFTVDPLARKVTYTNDGKGDSATDTFVFEDDLGNAINVTVNVGAASTIVISPSSLPAPTFGVPYNQIFSASGGTGPYTFSESGTLPGGLSFSGNTLSGTPNQAGTYNFSITAQDSLGASATKGYSLIVGNPTIVITQPPSAVINVPYSHTLASTGGNGPYTYTLHAGSTLPPGLSLSSGGGLTGTPTSLGSYSFQVESRDSSASPGPYTNITTLSLTVTNQPPTAGPVAATVAYGSTNNPITLALSGPSATSVAVGTQAAHGTATASGTTITYTPTAGYAGSDAFTYTASNAAGTSSAETVTVTVSPPTIVYAPVTPPHPKAGVAYSQSIASASGGIGPYTYATTATLPPGLSLGTDGVITGTPTAVSTFIIPVRATDHSTGTGPFTSAPANVTFTVDAPAIAFTTASLPNGAFDTLYSQTIAVSNGTAPYTYTIESGTLPSGMSLDSGTGLLSGRPSQAGPFSVTIKVTDSTTGTGAPFSNSKPYTLTIDAPTVTISPASLPNATVGTAYSQTLSASGGTTPYTYSVTNGALPPGTTLSSGTLSGTPTTAGDFNFTVGVQDHNGFPGSQTYSVHVAAIPPAAPTNAVATADTGQATVTFDAPVNTGGSPITNYTVTSHPGGLTQTANANAITVTGLTNGTSYTFSVKAINVAGPGPDSLESNAVTPRAPQTITFNPPASFNFGTSPTLTATTDSGLTPTFSSSGICSITTGGVLTFTAAGTCTVTASQDGSTTYLPAQSVIRQIDVLPVAPGAPVIGTATADNTKATVSFTAPASTGGAPVTSYIATSTDGSVSGTGTTSPITVSGLINGTAYKFTVKAANSAGPGTVSGESNSVTPQGPQTITFDNPGVQDFGTHPQLQASSTSHLDVSFDSTTPSICTVSNTGVLTTLAPGTCSIDATQAGNVEFHPADKVTQQFMIRVPGGAVSFQTGPTLPAATAETPYSVTLTAAGGAPAYTFDAPSGGLPTGLSLSPSGILSGTPLVAGTLSFSVRVTDQATQTATQNFQVTIAAPAVAITPTSVPGGTVGKAYSESFSTAGGVAPYAYTVTSGALPDGITLAAGTLSGTPTRAASFSFTVTATDQHGFQASQPYTLAIGEPAPVSVNDTAKVAANGSVSIPVTNGDSGPITSVAVVQQPAHGTATVDGLNVVYTPAHDYFGTDTLTYTATGPGGTSAPATVTITVAAGAVPVGAPQSATVLAGKSVTIHAAAGAANGPITAVTLVGKPSSGTAVVQGTDIVYTADADASGKVDFDFTLSNAFGVSQPAHVSVTVNARPVAPNLSASVIAGTTVQVDLTKTAHGGPFNAAKVMSISPANAGSATVTAAADGGYTLAFTAAPTFGGMAQISYTLTNAFATSDPGTVSISVTPRSDPSKDAEVLGVLDAQADATRRMATGQIGNFQRRLESLHGGGSVGGFSNGITMASASGMRRSDNTLNGMRDSMDERNNRYLVSPDAQPAPAASPSTGTSGAPGDIAFWTGGAVNFGKMQTGTSDNGIDFTTSGLSFGADKQVGSKLTLGAGIGYGHDASDIGQHGSRSSVDSYNVAVYGSYQPTRSTYIDAVIGYQWLQFDARRYVTDNGNMVHGDRDGKQVFGSLSVGYQHETDDMRLTPYGRLDIARASLDGYTEKGDAIYSLDYQGQTVKTSTATLGLLAQWSAKRDYGMWAPQLRAEFGHDMQGSSQATMRYADLLNGPLYRATLTGQSRNHTMLGAGLALQTLKGWLLRVEYQNYLDNTSRDNQSILLGVEKKFDP